MSPAALLAWLVAAEAAERRPLSLELDGRPLVEGVSYGPYREGQRPGGPAPSAEQILEDLRLVAERWGMIRLYSSRGPSEMVLRTIRDQELTVRVVLGAWIGADDPEANAAEVQRAIELANAFPEHVVAVSVGNETQVAWSGHRSPQGELVAHLRTVREAVAQPVTTADDYNFWNKPEAEVVAAEVDFLLLHAYAMWNGQQLDEAVGWTADVVGSIRSLHPELPIVIGETGWATHMDPAGDEAQHIRGAAGEAEQAAFYRDFTAWAVHEQLPHFWFEAFDEPWKGSASPDEVEKHWGLYRVDRTPKAALEGSP